MKLTIIFLGLFISSYHRLPIIDLFLPINNFGKYAFEVNSQVSENTTHQQERLKSTLLPNVLEDLDFT